MKNEREKHSLSVRLYPTEWEGLQELADWRDTTVTELIRAFISDVTDCSGNPEAYEKAIEYLDNGSWNPIGSRKNAEGEF